MQDYTQKNQNHNDRGRKEVDTVLKSDVKVSAWQTQKRIKTVTKFRMYPCPVPAHEHFPKVHEENNQTHAYTSFSLDHLHNL